MDLSMLARSALEAIREKEKEYERIEEERRQHPDRAQVGNNLPAWYEKRRQLSSAGR